MFSLGVLGLIPFYFVTASVSKTVLYNVIAHIF